MGGSGRVGNDDAAAPPFGEPNLRPLPLILRYLPGPALRFIYRHPLPLTEGVLLQCDVRMQTRQPVAIIRVDDFPRWDLDTEEFLAFHEVMKAYRIPYVLGITPFLEFAQGSKRELSGEDGRLLRRCIEDGVALAVHGFTHHKARPGKYTGEVDSYGVNELSNLILRADERFGQLGLPRAEAFIPPFNALTRENFSVLRRRYRVIFGGPLSLTRFGKYLPQIVDGTAYLPSYQPLYGSAAYVRRFVRRLARLRQIHVITLHWAWERADGYKGLRSLICDLAALMPIKSLGWLIAKLGLDAGTSEEGV